MPIKFVKFKNCKSLKNVSLNLNDINLLIGENGTGKTNIIKTLNYFYENLTDDNFNEGLHDKNNPYNQYFEISVEYDLKLLYMDNFNPEKNEYTKILRDNICQCDLYNQNNIILTLRQYKDSKPEWNYDYKIRKALKHIYPFYLFRCRRIKVSDWQLLWEIIGDLSRVSVESKTKINSHIKDIFADNKIIRKENKDIIEFLKNELKREELDVEEFNTKEIFNNLVQLYLNGEVLKKKDKSFDYYSDGTNLFGYLNTIIKLINKIAEKGLAEPIILIDEPEMSLHNNFVDRLSKNIVNKAKEKLKFIIATHSPRLTKHIIKKEKANIFHFSLKEDYSKIFKMKTDHLQNRYNIITEVEASLLFAKAIVYLEGNSDIELFLNENILNKYPKLNKIEFYHNLAETKKESLLSPDDSAYPVPYLFVVDMDSIIRYKDNEEKFVLNTSKKHLNPLAIKSNDNNQNNIKDKEKYSYGERRKTFSKIHDRLKELLKNTNYSFNEFLYIDQNFEKYNSLKKEIKKYCRKYNVFAVNTTIEGILINKNNSNIFYDWFISENPILKDKLDDIIKLYPNNKEYIVTIYRLIVDGKLNNQAKFKYSINKCDDEKEKLINKYKGNDIDFNKAEEILDLIDKNIRKKYGKTDGWITDFINYYFDRYNKFEKDFPELNQLLQKISNLI